MEPEKLGSQWSDHRSKKGMWAWKNVGHLVCTITITYAFLTRKEASPQVARSVVMTCALISHPLNQ